MSFSIYTTGTPDGVESAVKSSTGYGDSTLHDTIVKTIQAVLFSIPDNIRDLVIVDVDSGGHHDFSNPDYPSLNLSLKIKITKFAK